MKQLERVLGRAFESHAPYWIERGFSKRLARALAAAGIRTEEDLTSLRREEILQRVKGIGPKTERIVLEFGLPPCEGTPTRAHGAGVHQGSLWIDAGIAPCCAARLVRAGFTSMEHLEGASREDVLGIRGISEGTLAKCEQLLGHPLRTSIFVYWTDRGVPVRFANALHRAGIESLEALAEKSREELLGILGLGVGGLRCCEELLGHALPSVVEYWQLHGFTKATAWRLIRARVVSIDVLKAQLPRIERTLKKADLLACRRVLGYE